MSDGDRPAATDSVHMKPAEGPCDVHEWPTDGMGQRLILEMVARHGKGGVNVCVGCLRRARDDAMRKAGLSGKIEASDG